MRYSADGALNSVYTLIARLSEPSDPDDARLDEAMTIADGLIACGEDRSWASVWWAYSAQHYEMSDEALGRALDLLARVERPAEARAAALMLRAEIKMTQAVYSQSDPSPSEQRAWLEEAASLAPDWPSLQLRLARACKSDGQESAALEHATRALSLLKEAVPSDDPFDSAITGRNLDRDYVQREVDAIGVSRG